MSNTFSTVNLILTIVLFGALFGYTVYSDIQLENKMINLQKNTQDYLNQKFDDIDQKIEEESMLLRQESQDIRTEVADFRQKSSSEIELVKSNFQRLELKQEEELDELNSRINRVGFSGDDFSEIINDVIESIVSISTDRSVGSGVIVDREGYIVTNHHVIDRITAAGVRTYDGDLHGIYVVGSDPRRDIAVLKMEGSFPALDFANSNRVSIGDRVIALGSPGGLDFTVTQGIVSAKRERDGYMHIQTDAPVNPGSSGGPLIDVTGDIVGITKEKLEAFEGTGFAIESNEIEGYVEGLINDDKRRRS